MNAPSGVAHVVGGRGAWPPPSYAHGASDVRIQSLISLWIVHFMRMILIISFKTVHVKDDEKYNKSSTVN